MLRLAMILSCALLLGSASRVPAQQARPRTSFWFAAGFGGGWGRVSCDICRGDRLSGFSAYLRLGGRINPRVLMGGEAAAWRKSANAVDQTLLALGAAAFWYPPPGSALYLKGGLGWVTHRVESGPDVILSTGFGPQLGVGYEFPLGRGVYLAPYCNVVLGVVGGAVKFNGATVTGAPGVSLIQLGLALTER